MRTETIIAALSVVALAACAKDNAGTADSTAKMDTTSAPATTPTPTSTITDAGIFGFLDAFNVADSTFAMIASTKALTPT